MTPDEVHVVCYGFEKLKNHLYIHAAKTGDFLHKILVKYTGKELHIKPQKIFLFEWKTKLK